MTRCNLCSGKTVETLIEFGSHPIAHRFLETPDDEEYTHPLTLGACTACGLVQLVDPIPAEELYTTYHWLSSWKPNPHVPELVTALEQLAGLSEDSKVVEVGSNDGAFLAELRARGFRRLLGLEPAEDARSAAAERGLPTVRGYFTPEAAGEIVESFGTADLFVTRHVLEHVSDLPLFAEAMRIVLSPGARVLVEVPDFDFSQDALDYSALWEEHVNHFTRATIEELLGLAGVEVDRFESYAFSGRALVAWGHRAGNGPATPPERPAGVAAATREYRDRWPSFRTAIRDYFAGRRDAGRRVGVYGAGCRAATLINLCELGPLVDLLVDDQPEKQGKFMPGSRLAVTPGDALDESALDLCLLSVNAENEDTVIERHSSFGAGGGEFVSINPPSPRLPGFWKEL